VLNVGNSDVCGGQWLQSHDVCGRRISELYDRVPGDSNDLRRRTTNLGCLHVQDDLGRRQIDVFIDLPHRDTTR